MHDKPLPETIAGESTVDLDQGERLARANALIGAALRCDWQDAEMVMSALLEEFRAGAPLPAFAEIEDDAAFWAQMATFEELRAYFIACGRKLVRSGLGVRGRVRLARRVLSDLPPDQRSQAIAILASDSAAGRAAPVGLRGVRLTRQAHYHQMNESDPINSFQETDWTGAGASCNTALMQNDDQRSIHLQRVDDERNMRRFYTAALQPTLFGDVSLIRCWGRIGTSGRVSIETFEHEADAQNALDKLIGSKHRKGYRDL